MFLSLLKRKGYKTEIPKDWDGSKETLLVEGKELWEFVNCMSETKHELFKDYTLLVTRHFDARVKSLIKNIIMGSGRNKVPIAYYSYRIEFQARGMPHVHGVAWIKKQWLEDRGIVGYLSDHVDAAVSLANELISCEVAEGTELGEIVSSVQKHHHTKSCRKYDGQCRFGFPKLPCPETLMAEPLKEEIPDEEKQELLKQATETMQKAKAFLDSPECTDDTSYEAFLEEIETTKEDYERFIRITERGKVLV